VLSEPPEPVDTALREKDTQNYDGEIADRTGQSEVEIKVGAGETGLAFDPAVVQVDPGTAVTWSWTGEGGAHNVVAATPEGAFNSGDPVREDSAEYTVTFTEAGSYIYHCLPHQAIAMAGAVVVGEGGSADPEAVTEEGMTGDPPEETGPAATADQYLSENSANQYAGEVVDFTGPPTVTIEVGGGENGLAFDPPAIRVSRGAEIVWEWTGDGGAHNVVSAEESVSEFNSGVPVAEEGQTYSKTVEKAGAHLYYCAPHQAVGMVGAIVVEE
jgi:halocyanin-like protein